MFEMDRTLMLCDRTKYTNELVCERFTDADYGSMTSGRLCAEAWHFPADVAQAIFKAYEKDPRVAQVFEEMQSDGEDAKTLYMLAALETYLNEQDYIFSNCSIHTDYIGYERNDMTIIVIYFEDELQLYRSIVEG